MKYPGKVIRKGERGPAVRALQKRLEDAGFGPLALDGIFGPETEKALKRFQARHADATGRKLKVDGAAGPRTWEALFGSLSIPRPDVPPYPGQVLRRGHRDGVLVRRVQKRLNELGCGPLRVDGIFGPATEAAVRLFQSRFPDARGNPLKVDGLVGALTWAALFGRAAVPVIESADAPLPARALEAASGEVGEMEVPPGSNRGPRVDEYLRCVGLNPAGGSFAWCAAFVYWCYERGAESIGAANPLVRTAGVMNHWRQAPRRGARRILHGQALENPGLIRPGHIFIISSGGGFGHTGLVERVEGGTLITIEGNTNDGGSREGIGVFRRAGRKIAHINRGFIDYSA